MKKVIVLLSCSVLLASFVGLEQLLDPYWAGFELVVQRHQDMLHHEAHFFNPWQYRILSTYLLESAIQIWEKIPASNITTPTFLQEKGIILSIHLPYIWVKWTLLVVLFYIAASYFRIQGINSVKLQILGIWIMAFFLFPAQFSAGLSLDIYLEAIFYLLAALCILRKKWGWLPLICLFAVLNRESSGFIPLLLLITYLFNESPDSKDKGLSYEKSQLSLRNKGILIFLLSSITYVGGFIALRAYYGYPPAKSVYGNQSFWDFLTWNLGQPTTYFQMLRSFTLLPLFALWFYPRWPKFLKLWGWLILPPWLILHLGHAVVRETRLFLVPVGLILIPGLLWALQSEKKRKEVVRD